MAKVTISNISDIKLNVIDTERTQISQGDLAMHSKLVLDYLKNQYNLKPKNKGEATARGEQNFNGLSTSFPRISVYQNQNGENIVSADIAPTRFLFKQSAINLNQNENLTLEQRMEISPQLANVSLIVPVKVKGEYFLMGQVKGNAIGSGQIQGPLVAGGIDYKALHTENPLITSLQQECLEEVGMDLSYLNSTSFLFMTEESEVGSVNFSSIAQGVQLDNILSSYEASVKNKLTKEELEVQALAKLPMQGISLIPLEKGNFGMNDIEIYTPTQTGLNLARENRKIRPLTQAVADFMSEEKNKNLILERAGF
jgi:hypothetical protein